MKAFVFVLLTTLQIDTGENMDIQKCCLKHEELHFNGRDCVVRSENRSAELVTNGVTDLNTKIDENSLPEPFNITDIEISYSKVSSCSFNNFLLLDLNDTSRYEMSDMILKVKFLNASGDTFEIPFNKSQYCLDSIQYKNYSLVVRVCTESISHVKKCCHLDEQIQKKEGQLKCTPNMDRWSLNGSTFKKYASEDTVDDVLENSLSLCTLDNFNVTSYHHYLQKNSSLHPNIFRNSSNRTFLKYEFVCIDRYRKKHGEFEDVVGICLRSDEYLKPFFKVHYLCLAAAFLLVLSIGAIMIRTELRKSLHGQALACHAVALLMASILRAIWWFSHWYKPTKIAQCNTLAYILNYFMVASSIWLNIICINTVLEIRNSEAAGKTSNSRTIVWYSLYGWVLPAFHTLIVALQPTQANENSRSKAHVFHTRTCFFTEGDGTNHYKMEKFLFYYGPMSAILIVNIVLLIYSMMKCKELQSSVTAMRGSEKKIRPMSTKTVPEQALMYARLLISAGVGEMSAEIIAWALNDPIRHAPDGSRLAEKGLLKLEVGEKEFTFRILASTFDFLRALSVFILCCISRRTWRAVMHMFKGYVRLDRQPTARFAWPFQLRRQENGEAQENMLMSPLARPQ